MKRLGGLAAALLVAACSPVPSPSPVVNAPTSPPPATPPDEPTVAPVVFVTRSAAGLSFEALATWNVVWPHIWTMPVGPRLFLSNAPIVDPCAAESDGDSCWTPLSVLPANGILVTLSGSALPAFLPFPTPTLREVEVSDSCLQIGGERALTAVFPTAGLGVCLRGPEYATNEALVDHLMASVTE